MAPRPFVPVANALKVEMLYDLLGQRCENVFYVDRGSQAIAVAMAAIGPIVADWFVESLSPWLSQAVSLVGIKITDMSAADGPTLLYNTYMPLNGLDTNTPLPSNVSLAVKLNSTYRGRNSTGRQYLVGVPNGVQTGNTISPTYQVGVKTAYEALITALTGGDFALSVVSYVIAGVLRGEGLKSIIASISVDSILDSQRRRLTGRGR